ncbi:MAG: 3-phosphoshikimate 1-carboxyvinyltransferase, partial [Acidimicrobiales bacterium]
MLQIDPLKRPPNAELELAGSKSITNRALLIAALAEGKSTLSRALFAEDTLAMIYCLQAFGIDIKHDHTTATIAINGSGG